MHAIDVLTYGQQMVLATIGRYRADDWERIALGVWTAKDLVGHLGAFEARFADVLATFVDRPVETAYLDADPATFNDDQAAVRHDWTIDAVLDRVHRAPTSARWPTHGSSRTRSGARWGRSPGTDRNTPSTTSSCTRCTGTSANTTRSSTPRSRRASRASP